jgi:sugar phosphate isomerase/epimerase
VTRREILVGAAVCATPLWARNHWDRSRISALTDEIGATADDAASFAHDAGMLFVEVRNQPGSNREYAMSREADMKAAAAHLANENLKISVVNTSLLRFHWPGSPSADQARWDHRMEDLQKALRCAQIMGADKIRIFAGTRVDDPASMFQRIADTMSEMAAECEKEKVSLILENDPGTNIASCAEIAAVMKLVPSKWVGINWKPAPDGYPLLPKKRLLNVRVPAASLSPGRPESMNWKTILTALDKDGYGGRITLEVGQTANESFDLARDSLDQLVHIVREVS